MLILVGLLVGLVLVALVAPEGAWVEALLRAETWQGPQGIALFIAVYALWNCALPPAPLQALAGVYYGVAGGLLVIVVSTSAANAVSHGLARWLGRQWVADKVESTPRLAALEEAVDRAGWKGVALLRLSNLIPSNIANLLMGITSLRLTTILWASVVGSLPGWLLMLTLGSGGSFILGGGETTWIQWTVYIVSALAALGLLVGLGWRARKILNSYADEDAEY
jgi:uncharacterized membrane protein YdjX (TVP38/TMEM64 family)